GAKYISADAQGSPSKQLTDVESLISKGANVLVILAMDSEAILPAVKPAGNYAFVKGDKGDPNADFLFSGISEVLKGGMDAGKIKNVGESYSDGWKPDNAQKNMEQILTKNSNKIDAAVVENDGMAGGAVAALAAQGLAGVVPVSG